MKGNIYCNLLSKVYYLGNKTKLGRDRLDVDSKSTELGEIIYDLVVVSYKFLDSDDFHRELTYSDYIMWNDQSYNIRHIFFSTNGEINYVIGVEEYIEDDESKIQAEKCLELRMMFLAGRESHSSGRNVENIPSGFSLETALKKLDARIKDIEKKKWWQVWK
jgi:hypothetical protein